MNQFENNSYMKTALVTGPTGILLSLDEVKDHLRVDHDESDPLIQSFIMAATTQIENITNRKLLTQTWKAYADAWPSEFFTLPYGNLQSVTAVNYTDEDGVQVAVTASEYIVDIVSDPGRVVLGEDEQWPNDDLYPSNPIEIEFTCGYGDHTAQTITAASNASPIVITIADHGYSNADRVLISDVTGNTSANGTWTITKLDAATFSLGASSGNAVYISGGTAVKIEVPEPIRITAMVMVGDWYANRESMFIGPNFQYVEIPNYIITMLQPYRLFNRS